MRRIHLYLVILISVIVPFSACASFNNLFYPKQPTDIGNQSSTKGDQQAQKDKPQDIIFKPCKVGKEKFYYTLNREYDNSISVIEFRNVTSKYFGSETMPADRAEDPNFAKGVITLVAKDGYTIYRRFQIDNGVWSRPDDKVFNTTEDKRFQGNFPSSVTTEFFDNQWRFGTSPFSPLPSEISCPELTAKNSTLSKYFLPKDEVNKTNSVNTFLSNSNTQLSDEFNKTESDRKAAAENLNQNAKQIAERFLKKYLTLCNNNYYFETSQMTVIGIHGQHILVEIPTFGWQVKSKSLSGADNASITLEIPNATAHIWGQNYSRGDDGYKVSGESYSDSRKLETQPMPIYLERNETEWNISKSNRSPSKLTCEQVSKRMSETKE